jgi:hypothetical protein
MLLAASDTKRMTDMDVLAIDYAPPLPIWSRRPVRRAIAVLIPLILLTTIVARWGRPALSHARLLSHFYQCERYNPPPDLVVYDNNTASVAASVRPSTPWDGFYGIYSPPGRQPWPVLFLHKRTNSRGQRRLVVVEGWPVPIHKFGLTASVLRQSTPFTTPQMTVSNEMKMLPALVELGDRSLRWYAGQPDPADPAHFTIRYEINGTPGTVDGWLSDDDHVKLLQR